MVQGGPHVERIVIMLETGFSDLFPLIRRWESGWDIYPSTGVLNCSDTGLHGRLLSNLFSLFVDFETITCHMMPCTLALNIQSMLINILSSVYFQFYKFQTGKFTISKLRLNFFALA